MSLKIKEYRRIGRNKTLGVADIDLSDLEDGLTEQRQVNISTAGHVEVVLCRNQNPTLPKGVIIDKRLPALRIVLERNNYVPGEVIRGFVRYHERHKTAISAIRLSFAGHSHVEWTESSGETSTTYSSRISLLKHTSILFGSQDYDKKVNVGPDFYFEKAFEFRLPSELAASTWNQSTINNSYRVIAYIDRHKVANKVASIPFNIRTPPHLARRESAYAITRKFITEGDIELIVSAPLTFWAGSPYIVKVVIDNTKGSKPIESLKVELKGKMFYYSYDGGRYFTPIPGWGPKVYSARESSSSAPNHSILEDELDVVPVPPGQRRETTVGMLIPHTILPSLHSSLSPLIQTKFEVIATVKSNGGVFKTHKAKAELPVMCMHPTSKSDFEPSIEDISEMQCLAYSMPSPMSSSPYLVPYVGDSKKLIEGLSAKYPQFGSFDSFGDPVVPDHYLTADKKFHGYHFEHSWCFGDKPKWVTNEGIPPANIAMTSTVPPSDFAAKTEARMDETQVLEESDTD